jgi:hypothetical protein
VTISVIEPLVPKMRTDDLIPFRMIGSVIGIIPGIGAADPLWRSVSNDLTSQSPGN